MKSSEQNLSTRFDRVIVALCGHRRTVTIFAIPAGESRHELLVPRRSRSRRSAEVIRRESVAEAHLDSAGFAHTGVRESQSFSATPDRTNRLLLLLRVTLAGAPVDLQQPPIVGLAGDFHGGGASLAENDSPALPIGVRAFVGSVRSVFETIHLPRRIIPEFSFI